MSEIKRLKEENELLRFALSQKDGIINEQANKIKEWMDKYWEIKRSFEAMGVCGDPDPGTLVERMVEERYSEIYYSPDPGPGYTQSVAHFSSLTL